MYNEKAYNYTLLVMEVIAKFVASVFRLRLELVFHGWVIYYFNYEEY